jgi:hypothetical protein
MYHYRNKTHCVVTATQHAVLLQQHNTLYRYSNTTRCTVTATQHAVPLQQHNTLYRYNNTTRCTVKATQHAVTLQKPNTLYCSLYDIYWCFMTCYFFYSPAYLFTPDVTQLLFTAFKSTNTNTHTHTHTHRYNHDRFTGHTDKPQHT